MNPLDTTFQSFAMILLNLLLPLAVKLVLAGVVYKLILGAIQYVEKRITVEQFAQLQAVIKLLVAAAEQSGLQSALLQDGAEKKEWVIKELQAYLTRHGLPGIDVRLLSNSIEAAVLELNRSSPLALVEAVPLPSGGVTPAALQ